MKEREKTIEEKETIIGNKLSITHHYAQSYKKEDTVELMRTKRKDRFDHHMTLHAPPMHRYAFISTNNQLFK
jgi:hypothetical protein